MSENTADIAIIGAGASGLAASIAAAAKGGLKVILLEKQNEPAVKLYATGNGRCNYLNKGAKASDYYCSERPDYLPPAIDRQIYEGRVDELIDFFRAIGIEPHEEGDGRLYPRSMQAASVVKALVFGAKRLGVRIVCGFETVSVIKEGDLFAVISSDRRRLYARSVIIATGGKAGIQYGCTGDGYKLARAFGHRVEKPIPALTKLICEENIKPLAGVRARGMISLLNCSGSAASIVAEDRGEIQFTEDSLSGICTFNVSRFYRIYEGASYRAELDLLEEFSEIKLRELLLERRVRFAKEPAEMLFMGLLPSKLGTYILMRAGVGDPSQVLCGELSKDVIDALVPLCKELSFTITGTKGFKDAQVTAGGVSLSRIDPGTLESDLEEGLYFAGEVLDADGPCGGYNLTWAFASGITAGRSAAERSLKK